MKIEGDRNVDGRSLGEKMFLLLRSILLSWDSSCCCGNSGKRFCGIIWVMGNVGNVVVL